MNVETYNEHPKYFVEGVGPLLEAMEHFIPIGYNDISVAFVTESTICKLHGQFLNNSEPTDVITFPAETSEVDRSGEICISIDEALKYLHVNSLEDELTLYLVHGWLHLAGYDDIEEEDRCKMRDVEKRSLMFLNDQRYKRVKVLRV